MSAYAGYRKNWRPSSAVLCVLASDEEQYLTKHKDGSVAILAKGWALFPDVKPLISAGGGAQSVQRVMEVSRMAALMEEHGIPAVGEVPQSPGPVFIPSVCWRSIAPGILSTTRFIGMVLAGKEKLTVYDIGDGSMEWQVRAEGSLFYTKYGNYETKAVQLCRMYDLNGAYGLFGSWKVGRKRCHDHPYFGF